MRVEVIKDIKFIGTSRVIPAGEKLIVRPLLSSFVVEEGPFKNSMLSGSFLREVPEKTYTEKEYNHIMDLLDREREKNDRLGQAVHKLINIIYKKTFPGVIE